MQRETIDHFAQVYMFPLIIAITELCGLWIKYKERVIVHMAMAHKTESTGST